MFLYLFPNHAETICPICFRIGFQRRRITINRSHARNGKRVQDPFDVFGYGNAFKRHTSRKRRMIDTLQRVGQCDARQSGTVFKCTRADNLHAVRHDYTFQRAASAEKLVGNTGYSFRKHYARQRSTTLEDRAPELCHAVGQLDARQ